MCSVNTNNNASKSNNNKKNPAFGNALVNAWKFIDSSRGIQFTVEDMLGTNIPRTYSGAMSGYEYTGKVNWPYLWQEGIREFLTGPTMTLTPIGILGLVGKLSGKTANTHKNNIINLSYLAQQLPKENINQETFSESFIKKSTQDLLTQSLGKNANLENFDADIENLSNGISEYSKVLSKTKTKAEKKSAKAMLGNLQSEFEKILKTRKADFSNTDFRTATVSMSDNKTIKTNFETYVNYITAYIQDYTKVNKGQDGLINLADESINNFKNSWCGKRILTVGAMIFLTGYIMSYIPKIYTFFSGGINPAGKAIYDEAAKREGK